MAPVGADGKKQQTKQTKKMDSLIQIAAALPALFNLLAEMDGTIHVGLAGLGAGLGIGLVGAKAAEATGRNPGAEKAIMKISIIFAALAEGLIFIAIFLAK
jgi:F-type H+-transporting ATPase subunit c